MEKKVKDMKDKCILNLEWDYLGETTLMDKIKICSREIHMLSGRGGADIVAVHPKAMKFIEDIGEWDDIYDKESKKLNDKFDVRITERIEEDEIIIFKRINEDVYIDDLTGEVKYFFRFETEKREEIEGRVTGLGEVRFVYYDREQEGSEEKYRLFLKEHKTRIKILNYNE